MARAGVARLGVGLLGQRPLLRPLAGLADAQQQLGAAQLQPGVGAGAGGGVLQQLRRIGAVVECLAAARDGEETVHIGAAGKGARLGREGHGLVPEHAQVGEDELRPALAQVAEEHQAQALADVADGHAPGAVRGAGVPLGVGALARVRAAQGLQHLCLAQAAVQPRCGKERQQLGLGVQGEQVFQAQRAAGVEPAQGQQGLGRSAHVRDFRVGELVFQEPGPAAQQQAHQQGLRRHGQLREPGDEALLRRVEQAAVAPAHPGERALEVVQIVVAVGLQHRGACVRRGCEFIQLIGQTGPPGSPARCAY